MKKWHWSGDIDDEKELVTLWAWGRRNWMGDWCGKDHHLFSWLKEGQVKLLKPSEAENASLHEAGGAGRALEPPRAFRVKCLAYGRLWQSFKFVNAKFNVLSFFSCILIFKTFLIWTNLYIQKSCKYSTRSSLIFLAQLVLMLTSYCTMSRKLMSVQCY